uniref:Uncharacterized protein n=1 Tax=Candidatus Berkiella aquae TaxID=295108 RepID=A0A0Q9YMG4_9GAMM
MKNVILNKKLGFYSVNTSERYCAYTVYYKINEIKAMKVQQIDEY